jgi:DNA polymerase (family 10)
VPAHNADIAAIFDELGDLLELRRENPFRVRAYRRAAQVVRGQARELAEQLAAGFDPETLPGIGQDLATKIREIVASGRCRALDELRRQVPHGLEELLQLPGLGPARVRQLQAELGVTTPARLRQAIRQGRLRTLSGFGPKLEARLAAALERPAGGKRVLRNVAAQYGRGLAARLARVPGVARVELAGSYRRGRETVGDLDLLAVSSAPTRVIAALTGDEEVAEVLAAGNTRASVRLAGGLQVDLRVVPPRSFGAALHYFTGSKAHNIRLRRLAQGRGLKVNEYGVYRGERQVAGRTEESVFDSVGLPWIPPELREDGGEFEAAARGTLPALVSRADLRGDLHVHTDATDGSAGVAAMARAARAAGLGYMAVTDHSRHLGVYHGLDADRLARQMDAIDALDGRIRGLTVLKGIEVDILEDGSLALPDRLLARLDLVVGAAHGHFGLDRRRQTERLLRAIGHRHFSILAHPAGRLIGKRAPMDFDLERVLRACAGRGCFVELNSQPQRLDLDDSACRLAASLGVLVSIASDAHGTDDFALLEGGVTQARRGWLGPAQVLNARPLGELRALLRGTMR